MREWNARGALSWMNGCQPCRRWQTHTVCAKCHGQEWLCDICSASAAGLMEIFDDLWFGIDLHMCMRELIYDWLISVLSIVLCIACFCGLIGP